ncbi:MAG TPA: DNA gyrase subunit A [Thermoleophilia bacterium]|nr:DNA gyrase subunit A [Thermoleophilia bacterium]
MSDSLQTLEGKIEPIELEDEMRSSFIDYAMSVLTDRALPDVRDGLKPSQRRILVAMNDLGLAPNKAHRKCAKIAGDTSGNYHPHGEAVIYPTLVRMAQDFNMRYTLVDGQGNFGSVEGDSPAAMRYTEARFSKIAVEMLRDIDANTVDWMPNYDETRREPRVLPSRMPNLMVNGAAGIAVGMATNIPPHNLGEVVDAIVHLVDNPEATADDLMDFIKGPDFPTGGVILGTAGFKEAYRTGRGRIRVRAKAHTEQLKGNRSAIIVTELPYQVNRASLIDNIVELVKTKKITEISDLRNESDRAGMRLVIELKREAIPMVVLNKLYKHTQMQTTFGVINIALVGGVPRTLTLPEMLQAYIAFQKEIVIRRTKFELDKAETRAHILEGLLVALDNLDQIISIIRHAADGDTAREALMDTFELTRPQSQAILDLRLQKLTGLERDKVKEEHAGLLARIKELRELLGDENAVLGVIKSELTDIKRLYNDDRRTDIVPDEGEIDLEDLIAEEQMAITITKTGYVKRLPVATYRQQKRGGIGVAGMDLKEEDEVEHLFITSTHNFLLFFTSVGKVYRLKVHELPLAGRNAKGKHIVNLLPLRQDEKICAVINTRNFDESEGKYLILGTRKGIVKKTLFTSYNTKLKADGIIAIKIREDDELLAVRHTSGDDDVMMISRLGQAIRFHESDVRPTGRSASGVHGMRLRKGDEVIAMDIARDDSDLFVITENGFGKRTLVSEYHVQSRGGQGVRTIALTDRKGYLAGVKVVRENHEIVLQSREGVVIRMRADGISRYARSTQGVKVMNMREGDVVSAIARMVVSESGATDEEIDAD